MRQTQIAWSPNGIRKEGLKREASEELQEAIRIYLNSPDKVSKLKQSGKFSLFEVADATSKSYYVTHPDSLFPIGMLVCSKYENRWRSNTVFVVPTYRGQGLGSLLYEAAINSIGYLTSSEDLSVGSSKLWQSLIKKYKGWYVIPAGVSPSRKQMKIKIVGWKVKGEVYPVFNTLDGKTVSLDVLLKGKVGRVAASDGYYLVSK